MKGCQIYKINNTYKIVTMYQLESLSYISSNPIFIIPEFIEVEKLSKVVFDALRSSRTITESEENEIWLGNKLLKELKEKSYHDLYTKSTSCTVYLDRNIIEIQPNQ